MTTWLRVALAAQVLLFAAWGMQLLGSHRGANVVWLATEPVDPRDLLSGHYVALRYRIASSVPNCELPTDEGVGRAVWVQLVPTGETFETDEGPAIVSEAVSCSMSLPTGGVWILGKLDGGGRVVYGIERMFVPEDDPRREARSGTVVAKVALNEVFQPRLLDLVPRQRSGS